jgi:hypothetical protein
MAARDIYINLRPSTTQGAFVQSTKNLSAYTFSKFYREEKVSFRIFFLTPTPSAGVGSPAEIEDGISTYDCRIGIGTPGGAILASQSLDWDTDHFEGVLNINTEEMNGALDDSASGEISMTLEVELKNADDESTFQQPVTIRNEVLTLDGGVPTPNTENIFADSMEAVLTDNAEVNWTRSTNDIQARAAVWGDATLSAPLRIEITDDGGGLANPTTDSVAVTVGGVSGRRYSLTMRVRGVIEYNTYTGGTAFGAHGYIGGTAVSGSDDTWKLTISSPAQTYWLNHDSTGVSNEAVVMDDVLTVIADAGATVTLEYDAQGPSFQGNSLLLRAPGVAPFPEVFDGHFLDISLAAAQEFPLGEFVQNRWEVTGLTGGTATTLDGIPTEITSGEVIPTNAIAAVVISGVLSHYQLVAGTDAESSPDVIRPDDYDGSTNARVWKLRSAALPTKIAALNALTWTNNTLPIFTGATTVSTVASSSFQAADAELSALAGLTSAADKVPYFTGSGAAALADFTAFGRTLVDDANAAAARTTLGLSLYHENGTVGTAPVASGGIASVAIGNGAVASQNYALAFGRNATASGSESAVLGGINNIASGQYAAVIGGVLNMASSTGGLATGSYGLADLPSQHARGSNTIGSGFHQSSDITCDITTTDATPTEVLAGGSGRLLLRANTAWNFTIKVIARRAAGAGHAAWKIEGAIKRDGTVGSTVIFGDLEVSANSANEAGWDFAVSADTTNGALKMLFTGGAYNVRVTSAVQLSEVTYA